MRRGTTSVLVAFPFVVLALAGLADDGAAQFVTDPIKNDSLLLRNGDLITGEFRQLSRGLVTFKSDAMATINVKWTRVLSAKTDKQFEINLTDGRRFFGGLGPGGTLGRAEIRGESDTVEVAIRSIVDMVRLKSSFLRRIDGTIDLGANYTQQNNKVDLSSSSHFRYVHRKSRVVLNLSGNLTKQDSLSDISRANAQLTYSYEFRNRWLVAGAVSAEQNSQLSLDARITGGAGPGRLWIQSNGLLLTSLIAGSLSEERFEGEPPRNTGSVGLITALELFNWAGLSTDLSTTLSIERVVSDANRWRISFVADLRKEIVNNLYLSVGVNEQYDSNPPSAGVNKNDFSVRTALGFSFF